jgi:hypothetical protein
LCLILYIKIKVWKYIRWFDDIHFRLSSRISWFWKILCSFDVRNSPKEESLCFCKFSLIYQVRQHFSLFLVHNVVWNQVYRPFQLRDISLWLLLRRFHHQGFVSSMFWLRTLLMKLGKNSNLSSRTVVGWDQEKLKLLSCLLLIMAEPIRMSLLESTFYSPRNCLSCKWFSIEVRILLNRLNVHRTFCF